MAILFHDEYNILLLLVMNTIAHLLHDKNTVGLLISFKMNKCAHLGEYTILGQASLFAYRADNVQDE